MATSQNGTDRPPRKRKPKKRELGGKKPTKGYRGMGEKPVGDPKYHAMHTGRGEGGPPPIPPDYQVGPPIALPAGPVEQGPTLGSLTNAPYEVDTRPRGVGIQGATPATDWTAPGYGTVPAVPPIGVAHPNFVPPPTVHAGGPNPATPQYYLDRYAGGTPVLPQGGNYAIGDNRVVPPGPNGLGVPNPLGQQAMDSGELTPQNVEQIMNQQADNAAGLLPRLPTPAPAFDPRQFVLTAGEQSTPPATGVPGIVDDPAAQAMAAIHRRTGMPGGRPSGLLTGTGDTRVVTNIGEERQVEQPPQEAAQWTDLDRGQFVNRASRIASRISSGDPDENWARHQAHMNRMRIPQDTFAEDRARRGPTGDAADVLAHELRMAGNRGAGVGDGYSGGVGLGANRRSGGSDNPFRHMTDSKMKAKIKAIEEEAMDQTSNPEQQKALDEEAEAMRQDLVRRRRHDLGLLGQDDAQNWARHQANMDQMRQPQSKVGGDKIWLDKKTGDYMSGPNLPRGATDVSQN